MPAPKNYVKIEYPRKCEFCEYISNNPAMYHYHKRIHDKIPDNKLCDGGCGNIATTIRTNGRYMCLSNRDRCPEYLKTHSARVTGQWTGNEERRENTRRTLLDQVCGKPEIVAKQKETLRKKFGNFTPDQVKDFRHYARRVRRRAQKWAKDNGFEIGKQTYHVDHKLSVHDAFMAGLSESIVNHPANLQILPAKINCSKGPTSILTVDQLMKLINESKI